MKGTLPLGRVRGVELRVHALTPVVVVVVAAVTSRVGYAVGLVMMVIAHEVGHALLARRAGFTVTEIALNLFGGTCSYRGNPTPRSQAVVAWGGVMAQAILGMIALALHAIAYAPDTFLGDVLDIWLWPNLVMAVLNLIPAPAFDGGKAWLLMRPAELERTALQAKSRLIQRELRELTKGDQPKKNKFDIN